MLNLTNNLESYRILHESYDKFGFIKNLMFTLAANVILIQIKEEWGKEYTPDQ